MNGFFARLARFAVSKAAAFCYAVAVGVAGNLVFHIVQSHRAAPVVATVPQPPPSPAVADKPAVGEAATMPATTAAHPRAATPAALPASLRPAANPAPATLLPEPPSSASLLTRRHASVPRSWR